MRNGQFATLLGHNVIQYFRSRMAFADGCIGSCFFQASLHTQWDLTFWWGCRPLAGVPTGELLFCDPLGRSRSGRVPFCERMSRSVRRPRIWSAQLWLLVMTPMLCLFSHVLFSFNTNRITLPLNPPVSHFHPSFVYRLFVVCSSFAVEDSSPLIHGQLDWVVQISWMT